jgi:hypothetical protein
MAKTIDWYTFRLCVCSQPGFGFEITCLLPGSACAEARRLHVRVASVARTHRAKACPRRVMRG